jgi:hypothetical protein
LKKYCIDAGQFLDDLLEPGAAAHNRPARAGTNFKNTFPGLIAIELPFVVRSDAMDNQSAAGDCTTAG